MRIDKVQLKNIGPHRNLEIEFGVGLIGISGANGSGKSTLVNSIYAALTNDFSRFNVTKAELINNACGDEHSFICITGQHRGQAFKLTRWLRPNKAEFKIASRVYSKSNDINDAVTAELNLAKTVIDKYVFVDQWQMFQFLSQSESERAKTFQYLCGVEIATEIHKACSDYLAKNSVGEVIDNSLELQQSLQQLEAEMLQAKKKGLSAKKRLLSESEIEALNLVLNNWVKANTLRGQLKEAKGRLVDSQQAVQTVLKQLKAKKAVCIDLQLQVDNNRAEAEKAIQLVANYLAQVKIRTQLETYQNRLKKFKRALDEQLAEPVNEPAAVDLDALTKRVTVLQEEIKRDRPVATLNVETCPTCKQHVGEDYLTQVRKTYDRNKQELADVQTQITAATEAAEAYDQWKQTVTDLRQQITLTKQQIETLKTSTTLISEEQYATSLLVKQGFEKLTEQLQAITKAVTIATQATSTAKTKLQSLQTQIQNLRDEIVKLDVTKGAYDLAKVRMRQHLKRAETLLVAKTEYQQLRRSGQATLKVLQTLQRKLQAQAKIRNLNRMIETVADVFHWNQLPKAVAQANLERLVQDVNNNLVLFGNPFHVEADDDLTFQVHFSGQPPVKAKQLSGGQKVILAIAFRAALDQVFGHNVGMLFLDEPTAGLDSDNVGFFHNALKQLAQKVGEDRQLVVITHVTELSEAFDQWIEITRG